MAVWPSGVLLFVTVIVHVGAGSCSGGKYGYGCRYQCHCPLDNCSSTSGCQPASCSRGWSGPTCQKENVAFNKTTSSSSVYFQPSNAVNGDKRGDNVYRCFLSAFNGNYITSAWWRVDLGNIILVHDVIIHFRTDYKVRRNGIQIYIADTAASPNDGVNCYDVTGNRDGTDIPDVLTVTCSGEGRYLVLYTTTVNNELPGSGVTVPVMDFCEVEVEVCAPGTFGNDCDNYCHCEGDACNYVNGICPSGVCLPGWQTDRCDTACVQGSEYGAGCLKTCSARMCQGDASTCPRDTGRCTDGCLAGWKGEDCTTACAVGVEYGVGCGKTCSTRMCQGDTSTCPQGTGRCTDGCQAGWKGEDCTTACIDGVEYGVGCAKNCRARTCKEATTPCPRDTGQCDGGCQPGWEGEDCTSAVDSLPIEATDQISPLVAGCIGAVAMLVLLTVVAGAVCLWRKGDFRMTKTPRDSSIPETRPGPPVEVPAYDVLPENDYAKLDTIQTEYYDTLQPTVDYQNSDVRI